MSCNESVLAQFSWSLFYIICLIVTVEDLCLFFNLLCMLLDLKLFHRVIVFDLLLLETLYVELAEIIGHVQTPCRLCFAHIVDQFDFLLHQLSEIVHDLWELHESLVKLELVHHPKGRCVADNSHCVLAGAFDQDCFFAENLAWLKLGYLVANDPIVASVTLNLVFVLLNNQYPLSKLILFMQLSGLLNPIDVLLCCLGHLREGLMSTHHTCVVAFNHMILLIVHFISVAHYSVDFVLQVVFFLPQDLFRAILV